MFHIGLLPVICYPTHTHHILARLVDHVNRGGVAKYGLQKSINTVKIIFTESASRPI